MIKSFHIDNKRLHVLEYECLIDGPNVRTILFVHGFSQTGHSFDVVARQLATTARCYSMDLRGHGLSFWAKDYSRAAMAEDVCQVYEHVQANVLIGMSMGAAICTYVTALRLVNVRQLVTIDWAPFPENGAPSGVNDIHALFMMSWSSFDQAVDFLHQVNGKRSRGAIERSVRHQIARDKADGRWKWNTDPALIPASARKAKEAPSVMWEIASRVTCPVLVIRGADSKVLDSQRAQRLAENVFCRGNLVTIPRAGHSVAGDNPDAFVRAVKPLLGSSMFSPLRLGAIQLKHRVVLAPLTRMRCADRLPDELVVEYYSKRTTSGGLLISEGVHPSPQGAMGWNTPFLFTSKHAAAWKRVTDEGVNLIPATSRVANSRFLSSIAAKSKLALTKSPKSGLEDLQIVKAEIPRALETREVAGVVEQFYRSAIAAKEAGFDGVELHAANGYLVDQFLAGSVNKRKDEYGKDRTLFLRQIVEALLKVFDAGRVGVRVAPGGSYGDVKSEDAPSLFSAVCEMLNQMGIAYVHIIEPGTQGTSSQNQKYSGDIRLKDATVKLRGFFDGPIIYAGLLSKKRWDQGTVADAFAFGRPFITNPDLVHRLKNDIPLNKTKELFSKFYGDFMSRDHWAQGYTDYPISKL